MSAHLTLDAASKARLARGETLVHTEPVPGSKIPRLIVRAVVEAAPERVWPLIDQPGAYQEFMPRIKSSAELSRESTAEGERVVSRVTVGLPFPLKNLTAVCSAVHRITPGQRWERDWDLVRGDYKIDRGSWTLIPYDGDAARTLVVYQIHVIPNFPIPQRIQKVFQKSSMPELMNALRRRLETS